MLIDINLTVKFHNISASFLFSKYKEVSIEAPGWRLTHVSSGTSLIFCYRRRTVQPGLDPHIWILSIPIRISKSFSWSWRQKAWVIVTPTPTFVRSTCMNHKRRYQPVCCCSTNTTTLAARSVNRRLRWRMEELLLERQKELQKCRWWKQRNSVIRTCRSQFNHNPGLTLFLWGKGYVKSLKQREERPFLYQCDHRHWSSLWR